MPALSRPATESASSSVVMIGRKPLRPDGYEKKIDRNARPLSPGSNCAQPRQANRPLQREQL